MPASYSGLAERLGQHHGTQSLLRGDHVQIVSTPCVKTIFRNSRKPYLPGSRIQDGNRAAINLHKIIALIIMDDRRLRISGRKHADNNAHPNNCNPFHCSHSPCRQAAARRKVTGPVFYLRWYHRTRNRVNTCGSSPQPYPRWCSAIFQRTRKNIEYADRCRSSREKVTPPHIPLAFLCKSCYT